MTNKTDLTLRLFQKDHLLKMTNPFYRQTVSELFQWLQTSDAASEDQTTKFFSKKKIQAKIISRKETVVAGMEEVSSFFGKSISINVKISDGKKAKKDEVIAVISGNSNIILSLERTILNILQRMSGIATQTNILVTLIHRQTSKNERPFLAATRKTPWTVLDKKAVAAGGGITHRLTLADGILIKDNHLKILKTGSEEKAVVLALERILPQVHDAGVEIEVNTKKGANAAIQTFTNLKNDNYLIVMLDNWEAEEVKTFIKEMHTAKNLSRILFEASGSIYKENIARWMQTGVHIISSGALTHSAKAADLSLEIV